MKRKIETLMPVAADPAPADEEDEISELDDIAVEGEDDFSGDDEDAYDSDDEDYDEDEDDEEDDDEEEEDDSDDPDYEDLDTDELQAKNEALVQDNIALKGLLKEVQKELAKLKARHGYT